MEQIRLPPPGSTQILVRPLATGICGSDLLALSDPVGFRQAIEDAELPIGPFDTNDSIVPGHEFTAEVVQVGADVTDWAPGDVLIASPVVGADAAPREYLGFSMKYIGGLAEMALLDGFGHVRLPKGLSPLTAALTEPLTTGSAAVARSSVHPPAGAIVSGCGAAGLGVVMALNAMGVVPIVVADSSPARLRIAIHLGAHSAVDLRTGRDPIRDWLTLAADGQELFFFECSGTADSLPALLRSDLDFTFLAVLGGLMVNDGGAVRRKGGSGEPMEFCAGHGPVKSRQADVQRTLDLIRRNGANAMSLITGTTGLDGAPAAFELLAAGHPAGQDHVRIVVQPQHSEARVHTRHADGMDDADRARRVGESRMTPIL